MHVFRHSAKDFINVVENDYLPVLLGLNKSEQFVTERLDSVQAGLALIKLLKKQLDAEKCNEHVKIVR